MTGITLITITERIHTQALVQTAARKNVTEQRRVSPPTRLFRGIMGN